MRLDPDGRKDKVPRFGFWFCFLDLGQNPKTKTGLLYIPKAKSVKDPFLIIGLLALAQNQKHHLWPKPKKRKMDELDLWLLDNRAATASSSRFQNQAPAPAALAAA